MIHASGGPSSASARTRDRSAGVAHSAVAATAAEYEMPDPDPDERLSDDEHGEVRSGRAHQRADTRASRLAPRRSSRSPKRVASSPTVSAATPAASPDTVRSCPAVAIETSRSPATSGSSGLRTTSAACDAASAASSVMPTARGPSAHQMMIGTVPPSALHAAPVTYDARSEQRKTITDGDLLRVARVVRAAGPRRPSRAPRRDRPAGRRAPRRRATRRSPVGPGVTALQRMPSFAYRSATSRESDRTAAFVTE